METIKKFIEVNARVIVATVLIVAAIVAVSFAGSNDDSTDSTSTDQEQSTTEVTEQASDENADDGQKPAVPNGDAIGREPQAGPVEVANEAEAYTAIVRKGDNQTVIVRQMVNEYLADQNKELNAPQRLYMETVLVNSLPRNDLVFAEATITLEKSQIDTVVGEAESLSSAAQDRWSAYL